jgi:hypothetical protein
MENTGDPAVAMFLREIDAATHVLDGLEGLPALTVTLSGDEPCVVIGGRPEEPLSSQRTLVDVLARVWKVSPVLAAGLGRAYNYRAETSLDGVQILALTSSLSIPGLLASTATPVARPIAETLCALRGTRSWLQNAPAGLLEEAIIRDDGPGIRIQAVARPSSDPRAVVEALLAGLPADITMHGSKIRGHGLLPNGLPVTVIT